ncbi:hypothetical protein MMC12_006128 [Toensbergia leucococca]|nr:hypothetical protein [Toensbergia leucococca]
MGGTDIYDRDQRFAPRLYQEQRGPYSAITSQTQPAPSYGVTYSQGPQSAPGVLADYSFRYPPANSSSLSSPYVSPHTEVPRQFPSEPHLQQPRYAAHAYQHSQYQGSQLRPTPQLLQPLATYQQNASSSQAPMSAPLSYIPRLQDSDDHPSTHFASALSTITNQRSLYQTTQQGQFLDAPLIPSQQNRLSDWRPSLPSLLPPLQSSTTFAPSRDNLNRPYNNFIAPSIEGNTSMRAPTLTESDHHRENQEASSALPQNYDSTEEEKREAG